MTSDDFGERLWTPRVYCYYEEELGGYTSPDAFLFYACFKNESVGHQQNYIVIVTSPTLGNFAYTAA